MPQVYKCVYKYTFDSKDRTTKQNYALLSSNFILAINQAKSTIFLVLYTTFKSIDLM